MFLSATTKNMSNTVKLHIRPAGIIIFFQIVWAFCNFERNKKIEIWLLLEGEPYQKFHQGNNIY